MAKIKKWYQSRTMLLAILQGLSGVVVVFATEYPELGILAIAKSFIDAGLRSITTESIF